MKNDIEKQLENLKPTRPLSDDFTTSTISKLSAHKVALPWIGLIKRSTILAVFLVILLISGVSYATANWPEITSKFSDETLLNTGNRVIGVDVNNCNYFDAEPGKIINTQEKVYYEINKDSTFTNDQIVSMVKGICEENRNNSFVNNLFKSTLKQDIGASSSLVYTIKDVQPSSLTLQLDKVYQQIGTATDKTITFSKLSPDVKVYDGNNPIAYSGLKTGDSVVLIAKDASRPDPWANPDQLNVVGIIRVPSFTGDPSSFYAHLGNDFVRTEPCKNEPVKFCEAYPFNPKQ